MRATKQIPGVLVIATLLALSPAVAAGPAQIVQTYVEATADLPGEGIVIEPGGLFEGFVLLDFCYEFGGMNLLGGEFEFTLAVDFAPDWLDVRIVGGDVRYLTPPRGPELASGCVWVDYFQLRLTVALDAPRGDTGTVLFHITADAVGDVGTYQTPDEAYAQGTVTVAP